MFQTWTLYLWTKEMYVTRFITTPIFNQNIMNWKKISMIDILLSSRMEFQEFSFIIYFFYTSHILTSKKSRKRKPLNFNAFEYVKRFCLNESKFWRTSLAYTRISNRYFTINSPLGPSRVFIRTRSRKRPFFPTGDPREALFLPVTRGPFYSCIYLFIYLIYRLPPQPSETERFHRRCM